MCLLFLPLFIQYNVLRFIPTETGINILFLIAESYSWFNHIVFIHVLVDGHFVAFLLL